MMIMLSNFEEFSEYYSTALKENPDWLSGAMWYDREDIVRLLRKMNYSDSIAYDLADFILLKATHAFNRGVWNGLKYATKYATK
jgi:hypothetical protein